MRRPPLDLDEVAADVERVAALITAGATQPAAWRYLATGSAGGTADLAGRVASAASAGRPLAAVFTDADPAWRRVGALVGLAAETGAPLSEALRVAAAGLRAEAELDRAVAGSVAGPAASARLVLLLPPGSALLGWAFGFDVPAVLFGSAVGFGLLAVGGVLLAGAWLWSRRLIRVAARRPVATGLALELLAAGVGAGLPVPGARRAGDRAAAAAGLPPLDPVDVDRVLRFAADAGLPVVALLGAEAARLHRAAVAEARVRATVLAVRLLAPLGALVLPAFLLLGAAPIGIAILASATAPL